MTSVSISRILSLICLLSLVSACQVGRFVVYNFANITDHKIFPKRNLEKNASPFIFKTRNTPNAPATMTSPKRGELSFDDYLEKSSTVAFLVIKNDTIQYEKYFNGYDDASIVASFSMAKSVSSLLIGCAMDDGFIKSVDEPITNYIPELIPNGLGNVTIKHLLQMTSGIDFKESYVNPFGDAANFYYGTNLRKSIAKMKPARKAGETFEYISGNSQLLGLVLERALKNKTVSAYLQERVWSPIGMEFEGSWSLDKEKNGLEKTFCCLNARARDFAKIGRLYLNKGNWNGQQIVSSDWVAASTKVDTTEGSASFYQYQWWLPTSNGDFTARGILGQFIYVNPNKNLIIVRLGKKHGKVDWMKALPKIADFY